MRSFITIIAIVISIGALASFLMRGVAHSSADKMTNETAIFAGGCFWCVESDFDKVDRVISTTSGYSGGHKNNPAYREVSAGTTGHAEVVKVVYDPKKVSYKTLLGIFWKSIDPITPNRQFCDSGSQYRSAIFYLDKNQKRLAEESKKKLENEKPFSGKIVTEVSAATQLYPAEEYHQNYYLKNPLRYKYYRYSCGRDKRLQALWGGESS